MYKYTFSLLLLKEQRERWAFKMVGGCLCCCVWVLVGASCAHKHVIKEIGKGIGLGMRFDYIFKGFPPQGGGKSSCGWSEKRQPSLPSPLPSARQRNEKCLKSETSVVQVCKPYGIRLSLVLSSCFFPPSLLKLFFSSSSSCVVFVYKFLFFAH